MYLYNEVLNNKKYLELTKEIENIKFITDGKWNWEHVLGHFKRVADYVKNILSQLNTDNRTIDLGMTAALLHDVGLSKGDKVDHALESSKMFTLFLDESHITQAEEDLLRQAILDHSKGNNIKSLVGLALVLADKLDITYHRTENSSIKDHMNNEVQKIRKIDITITDNDLIVNYITNDDLDINIFKEWPKPITIPSKASKYLNRNYKFLINEKQVDVSDFINNL